MSDAVVGLLLSVRKCKVQTAKKKGQVLYYYQNRSFWLRTQLFSECVPSNLYPWVALRWIIIDTNLLLPMLNNTAMSCNFCEPVYVQNPSYRLHFDHTFFVTCADRICVLMYLELRALRGNNFVCNATRLIVTPPKISDKNRTFLFFFFPAYLFYGF
jgi:hypothetical protein